MRIIPNRSSLLFSLSLLSLSVYFRYSPHLKPFAGCIVFKGGGLEQPHPVRPSGKVTLVLCRRPLVCIIPERDNKGSNPQFPQYVQPEQILFNGRIESYQHVAGYLVRFHMPDHLFQTVGRDPVGANPTRYECSVSSSFYSDARLVPRS